VTGAFLAALVASVLLTRVVLSIARRRELRQQEREDGPATHLTKQGTPSLGGLALVPAIVLAAAAVLLPHYGPERFGASPALLVLAVGALFALLGLADDWAKVRGGDSRGVKARWRILIEIGLAAGFVCLLRVPAGDSSWGFGALVSGLGPYGDLLWRALGVFVVVGAANAVNFTDGVDGLAATTVAIWGGVLALALLFTGNPAYAALAAAITGGAAGFLWFNSNKAKIFMGDVGSLGLGALMGALAVITDLQWFLALSGVVFIVEVLSVVLQVTYFRATKGKRLFRMTPIHHAFELRGWSEPQLVARFAIIGLAAGGLALMLFGYYT
jgi:phospho-N-acetylmuramoyl-pentapeptide-transferase